MKWIEVNTYEEMSEVAATIFSKQIQEKPDSVLGLATGGSPVGMYKELVARHQAGHLSFKEVQTFNLDEYVGIEQSSPASYFTFMHEKLFNFVDIQSKNVHLPNGQAANLAEECATYDKRIEEAGGIDLPTHAITTGIHSIMKAKEIVLIAFGEKKLAAIEKLKSGHITEEFPASQLLNHPNVTVIYGGTN